jgi:hypothetical protein
MGFLDASYGQKAVGSYFPDTPAPSAPLSTSALSTLTGVDTTALEAALFGKDIPVFVGGQALMGCRIIEGPFLHVVSGVNVVDFIATCAVSANPGGTRTITSLSLNGTRSWTSAGGPIGTPFAGMTVNVKTGTENQTPFASSVTRYGANAVPYRSHICVEILNCPLDAFNDVIPFASIFVHEADSITRNDALTVLAKYARYDSSEYAFNVTGSDTFWIVPQQTDFISYMQNLRTIFRNWNITATDKLRVFESGTSVTSTITRSNTTSGSLKLTRADPLSIPRQRILSFIDVDRDNAINTAPATLERFPVAVTASQSPQTVELPIGMTLSDALFDANRSLLIDDLARKKMSFTGMNALHGSEPGDIVYFNDDPTITFLGRIVSVARKAADYGTDVTAEQIDFSSSIISESAATAESVTLADTGSALLLRGAAIAESVTLADTASAISGVLSSVSESVSLSDSEGAKLASTNTTAESVSLADTDIGLIVTADSASESMTLADTKDGTVLHSTVRQVGIFSPSFGLIYVNSGSSIRQTSLPGISVDEGT